MSKYFFKTIEKLREIEEGRNEGFRIADDLFGLTFNDGFLEEYEEYREQQDANSLIEAFLLNTLRYDDQYISASEQIKKYPLATRKFVYQIARDDVPRLNEIPENYDRLKSVIREYAGKNSLNLNKNRSDSVARAYEFFQFYNRELARFDPLINVIRDKSIQYFDLRYMKENGIPFLREEVTIPYVYDEEEKNFQLSYTVSPLEEGLYLSLLRYIAAVEEEVQRQAALVDRVLFFIEQNQSLRQLEAEIESQQRVIDRLYVEERDQQEPKVRRLVQDVYETVIEGSYAAYNDDYARSDNQERKVELANIKLDLLNELETIHPKLLRVYEILETVDEGYMVEVWNAFTFSRYMQREKERLWDAGELLYMHYIDQLRSEEVYVELRVWIQKMENLAQRLNELREEDTRRLERRIGRTKDPKEIEEILELK
ncbi:hypothetical protein A3SI_08641 [Nitritalea halalkaliphila LW7]|uniref:Uncharacterized protein n=1 Tax=Nitritalea halalkaliphila LW7 TaxID=1189621 RepID=I5C4L9_9BACT|nr:hypothetical protein [Nitritalea halalkaliphila]EIM76771.1 hypothetical protein A3SI_08641 [Nitritalea halalkaliphila LW7]